MEVVGTSIITTGVLTFVLRSWFTERLKGSIQTEYAQKLETLKAQLKADADARLEVHKANLKASGDVELEKLRSQLAASAAERNTLMNALTQRRFEAIAKIHASLTRFYKALAALTAAFRPTGTDEQKLMQDLFDASLLFDESFVEQQIFLTGSTAKRIEDIRQTMVSKANLFQYTVAWDVNSPERPQRWMELDIAVRGPVSDAMKELAHELRVLLGDKPELEASPAVRVESATASV